MSARQPFLRFRTGLNASLRIAVADWLPQEMIADIRASFAEPMAQGLDRELEIVLVSTPEILSSSSQSLYDAVVTSTNFHPWLYPAHSFFNSLPFGLDSKAKIAWLGSAEASVLQDRFFRSLGFKSHAIGVGSDEAGVLATRDLDGSNLNGVRIALGDSRSAWLAKYGLVGKALTPGAQIEALGAGSLDVTEPLPPSAIRVIARALSATSLRYYEFPRIRTAPTAHLLWRSASWSALDERQRALSAQLANTALSEVSRAWQAREAAFGTELRARYGTRSIPTALVSSMEADALAGRAQIAAYSAFAGEVARSYEKAELSARPKVIFG